MITLCLIAISQGSLLLKDCYNPDKIYAARTGYSDMLEINPKEIAAMGLDPDKKAITKIELLGFKMPTQHEDIKR
jgi:hypothetical protein